MKISIITVTYNSANTVRDTLKSVGEQAAGDVEHIIVDGQSTDDTLLIVKDFPHISRIVSEKDSGIYEAMNKGLALASGEIIGILNSDDVFAHSQVLDKIRNIFADEKVDVCYADLQYVQQDDMEKVVRTWKSGHYKPGSFHKGWMPPHPTVFVRRRVYDKIGNFDTRFKSAADYELLLRMFVKHHFHIHYLPEIIIKMRAGGMSNASFKHRLNANKEDRKAWKVNNLRPGFFTLYLKPIRKITQYLKR